MKRYAPAVLLVLAVLFFGWQALGELPPAPTIRMQPIAPEALKPALNRKIWTEREQHKYKLTAPLPGIIDRGAIQPGLSSYAAMFCMFQTPDGKMHFLAPFDGPDGWNMVHVNLTDARATMLRGKGSVEGRYCYDPARNVMHLTNCYGQGYWSIYDLAADTVSLLAGPMWAINNIIMGTDGMIWASGLTGGPVASYNPATGVLKTDWPQAHPDAQYIESFGADANYIYCGCRGMTDAIGRFLVVIDRANPHNVMTFNHGQGDASANVAPGARDGKYYYCRGEGAKNKYRTSFYALPPVNGRLTQVSDPRMDTYSMYHCVAGSPQDRAWEKKYRWEVNLDKYLPMQGTQEYSEIKFRHPMGIGPWTTVSVPYTGPWGEGNSAAVIGVSPTKVVSFNQYLVEYDYVKNIRSVKGQTFISPYSIMRYDPTEEIYLLGYARSTLRYDPNKPWTLVASNAKPFSPRDPKRPNPYKIATVESGHYHFAADYDAYGLVWIASNYTRTGSDYGVLVWYNPVDGTSGTVPGLQAVLAPRATMLRALAMTNHRTKICVSGSDGKIYVIDTATKTLEHTWTLSPNLFHAIIEVGDDHLLVVQASIDDASGNVSRVTKLRISTGEILFDHPIGVAGWAFGAQSANSKYRYAWRLVKGPDNFGWMFVGDHLCRIDPATGVFSKVCDAPHGSLVFNGADLGIYGCDAKEQRNHFLYFPKILTRITREKP
jgi:hypothetical protein